MTSIDFLERIKSLNRECFRFINYKNVSFGRGFLNVLYFIIVLPFVLCTLFAELFYYVFLFLYELLLSPTKYLHGILTNEKNQVRTPAEVVVYLVAFPAIFGLYCLISIFSFVFFVLYFLLNVSMYVWTMGGIHFVPFITREKDNLREEPLEKQSTKKVLIFVCIAGVLFVGLIVFGILYQTESPYASYDDYYDDYYYRYNYHPSSTYLFYEKMVKILQYCYLGFTLVYSFIAFRNKKNVEKKQTVEELTKSDSQEYQEI